MRVSLRRVWTRVTLIMCVGARIVNKRVDACHVDMCVDARLINMCMDTCHIVRGCAYL